MAKGYLVGTYRSVSDPDKLAAYGKLAKPALEAAGGRILARGGRVTAFEAGVPERTVLVEFPSYDAAIAAYESEDYQRAVAVLGGGAVRDVRVVEGLD
ncbi:DUF1330 domain-containing protein [Streptomyces sp. CT34]|uniref:DUF1330 domain-containing protein n=1 Tax=Streptomyces sp. CT34 TaxID=1553907 RepID=UPI0005B80B07|nr:DUF1330 domain-containing protein [Streptomyces sp. CT34]